MKNKNTIKTLDYLYKKGRLEDLEKEALEFINNGYLHKKINFYLKQSFENSYNNNKTENEILEVLEKLDYMYEFGEKKDVRLLILMYIKKGYRDERILSYLDKITPNMMKVYLIKVILFILIIYLFYFLITIGMY